MKKKHEKVENKIAHIKKEREKLKVETSVTMYNLMSAQDDLIYDSCQKTSSKDSVERTRNFIKTMVYGTTEKYDFMDKEKNKVMKKPPGQESKSKLSKRGHQAQKAAAKKERMNKIRVGNKNLCPTLPMKEIQKKLHLLSLKSKMILLRKITMLMQKRLKVHFKIILNEKRAQ